MIFFLGGGRYWEWVGADWCVQYVHLTSGVSPPNPTGALLMDPAGGPPFPDLVCPDQSTAFLLAMTPLDTTKK